MVGITLTEALKPEILEHLRQKHLTINELAKVLDRNYYTTRAALQLLIQEGSVRPVGNIARGSKYMLMNEHGPNHSMPTIHVDGAKYKLIDLLSTRNQTAPAAAQAVLNLPRHLVRLFKIGESANKGHAEAGVSLESVRIQMSEDRAALARAVEIYDQVLNNPHAWTTERLKLWPDDVTYDEKEVQATYDHFF